MLVNMEVSLTMWKDKPIIFKRNIKKNLQSCWHIKDKMKIKTHDTLTLEQEIICVDSKLFVELDESKSGHVHFGDTFKILVKDKSKLSYDVLVVMISHSPQNNGIIKRKK